MSQKSFQGKKFKTKNITFYFYFWKRLLHWQGWIRAGDWPLAKKINLVRIRSSDLWRIWCWIINSWLLTSQAISLLCWSLDFLRWSSRHWPDYTKQLKTAWKCTTKDKLTHIFTKNFANFTRETFFICVEFLPVTSLLH